MIFKKIKDWFMKDAEEKPVIKPVRKRKEKKTILNWIFTRWYFYLGLGWIIFGYLGGEIFGSYANGLKMILIGIAHFIFLFINLFRFLEKRKTRILKK